MRNGLGTSLVILIPSSACRSTCSNSLGGPPVRDMSGAFSSVPAALQSRWYAPDGVAPLGANSGMPPGMRPPPWVWSGYPLAGSMCGGAPSGMPPCFGSARGPQPGQQRGKKRARTGDSPHDVRGADSALTPEEALAASRALKALALDLERGQRLSNGVSPRTIRSLLNELCTAPKSEQFGSSEDVDETNIGEFRLADLGAGSKRRLLRQVRREYKLQPNECQNLNGGVITTEACCTDQSCAVRPSCASGAQAHVVLTDPERLKLWRRAKVFSVTRAPP